MKVYVLLLIRESSSDSYAVQQCLQCSATCSGFCLPAAGQEEIHTVILDRWKHMA